jgi:hypothetical protein
MNKVITLKSEYQRDHAINTIRELPLEPVCDVHITLHKENRSLAQNRLLHKWFGEISKETGETTEDVKIRYKGKFLIDIYMQREDSEYAQTINTLRELYRQGHKKDATYLHAQVVRLTSTADANIEEMTEFLNLIEMDAGTHGIQLSRPDDYHKALGV